MAPLAIRACTATSAVGPGREALAQALRDGRSGLRRNDFGKGATDAARLDCWIGRVDGLETLELPASLMPWDSRNNRLAWLALAQDGMREAIEDAIARFGAERVAVIVGTSTSSIGSTEQAYTALEDGEFAEEFARPHVHTPHSLGEFVQQATGIRARASPWPPRARPARRCSRRRRG